MTDSHEQWVRRVVDLDDRRDAVPSLNGVEVGQWWRNVHTGHVERVVEIRLGGLGAHVGHYESVMLDDGDSFGGMGWALWSIADHWELVLRLEEGATVLREGSDGQLELAVEEWEVAPEQPPWGNCTRSEEVRQSVNHRRPSHSVAA